jgi:hypothetical protein
VHADHATAEVGVAEVVDGVLDSGCWAQLAEDFLRAFECSGVMGKLNRLQEPGVCAYVQLCFVAGQQIWDFVVVVSAYSIGMGKLMWTTIDHVPVVGEQALK